MSLTREDMAPALSAIAPIELPSYSWHRHLPTENIQRLVALSYGLHPRHMTGRTQEWPIARARQVAMYLTRKLTNRSSTMIGRSFGGRDHTTVLHAIRTVERRMKADPLVKADVAALEKALKG